MSTDPSQPAERPPAPTVVALVLATESSAVDACLDDLGEQVYEPTQVIVIGGDDDVRQVAGEHDALWRPSLRPVVAELPPTVTYVWMLRDAARPRPLALLHLVEDGGRVDASVAGSKILDATETDRLVSVGYATDVFDARYSGLQVGEVDQAQYDVIRDVASISGTSMLIRRDLLLGLDGVDAVMAPTSAAVDLCQRARLRGGRVVVIPSSEVLYAAPERRPDWRERAGEIRSMIKAYSPITLSWTLPLVALVGLVEGIAGLFLGRWLTLPGVVVAWSWNLVHLPSAIRGRIQARRGRVVGDEELFRYQVSGSARLRAVLDESLDRIRRRFPEGVLSGFSEAVEAGQQRIRNPAFFVSLIVVVFGLVATREVWTEHLPVTGFSLPPPESGLDTLRAYAGGWNPAGLGSPEVFRPAVAATAVVQTMLLGNGGLAVAVMTVTAFIAGAFGTGRLLRAWGVGSVAGYFAGMVLMAGPAVRSAVGESHWTFVIGVAALPWAVGGALRPFPKVWSERFSRLAAVSVATGVVAAFIPLALLVPLAATSLWALIGLGDRWWGVARAAVGAAAAAVLLMPWILYVDVRSLVTAGDPAFWSPPAVVTTLVAIAAVGTVIAADRAIGSVAGWGGLLAVLGVLVARLGDLGAGDDVLLAGQAAAAFGTAVIVGAALEVGSRRRGLAGLPSSIGLTAVGAAVVVVASTALVLGPGRAGLPEDDLSGRLAFAVPTTEPPARILMLGTGDIPGTTRSLEGLPYRVLTPPHPDSWDARLAEPRLGDERLHDTLLEILDGGVRRAGERLAPFGIGWVVFTEPSPVEAILEAQLDLVALRSLDFPVFRNEVPARVAEGSDGVAWEPSGTGFAAPDGAQGSAVVVAVNGDDRWGPGTWSQQDWANRVETSSGKVDFEGHTPRLMMGVASGVWLVALVAIVVGGRRRRESRS